MPNWKKVIVSGSDAVLNSATASAGFYGTASWAISASNALTASYVNPLTQNVQITGSLNIGGGSTASGLYSVAQGTNTTASGPYSHASGQSSQATGTGSFAEGELTLASGLDSHAEGYNTKSTGAASHAEGNSTQATGNASHAEGYGPQATALAAHAEGYNSIASAEAAHAEGHTTTASGQAAHAEGFGTTASAKAAHAEGSGSVALGIGSHAGGLGTIASGAYQTAIGTYNTQGDNTSLFVIGNGTASSRSDVVRVNDSIVQITGSLQVSGSTSIFTNDAVYGVTARFNIPYGGNAQFVDASSGNAIYIYPLNGSANISGYNYGTAGFAIQGSGGSTLKLFTDTATRPVQIQHDQSYGNVVIGTTSDPGYRLFVSGSTGISNNLTITGSTVSVGGFTGSLQGTSSWAINAQTASYLNTLNQDLIFNGNLTLNGTASITYLNVIYETASVIYSSGSNQFGDDINDTQTLTGTVLISGSTQITGSLNVNGSQIYLQTNQFIVENVDITGSLIEATTAGGVFIWDSLVGSGSADFNNRQLIKSDGITVAFDWENGRLSGSVSISGSLTDIDTIQFNTSSNVPLTPGGINWDDGTGTLNVLLKGGNIDLQVGQENVVLIHNGEGTTLNKGEVVYVSGSVGNRPSVKRAQGISDGYSATTLGFVAETITAGTEGYVTTFGMLNNIDTSGELEGAPVWLSPTVAGGWTTTKPQAPQHTVLLGYIVRVDSIVGSIFVHISNGWELEELHNVLITSDTSSYGDLLVQSGSLWINSKQLTGSYYLTGSLEATSLTGSLFGTASWATTSSNSLTASYVNPLVQTVRITGSIEISGSKSSFTNAAPNSTTAEFYTGGSGNVKFTDLGSGKYVSITPEGGQIGGVNYGAVGLTLLGASSVVRLLTDSATNPVILQLGSGYGNVLVGTSTDPGYKFFVSGSTGISNNLTVTGSTVSVGGFTGSLQGTSSWASNAVTASYILQAESASFASTASYVLQAVSASYVATASYVNGLITKNNVVAAGAFAGNPRKATVTFTTPFANANYTITITGEDSRTWTIESKVSGSFVINSNSAVAPTGNTYWQAMNYGEYNS